MKDNIKIIRDMDMEYTIGSNVVENTKVDGELIKSTAMVYIIGQMEVNTLGNGKIIK
jgi:hypothetical protein